MTAWHDFPLLTRQTALSLGAPPKSSIDECWRIAKRAYDIPDNPAKNNTMAQISAEALWVQDDRPYYDLYPSVAEAFMHVDLEKLTCEQLRLPLPVLMVRVQAGREPELSPTMRLRSLLIGEMVVNGTRGWILSINSGQTIDSRGWKIPVHSVCGVRMINGTTFYSHLLDGRKNPYCGDYVDAEAVDNAFRLVATLCLLKGDTDLINPLPLDADRERYDRTHDPKLIEKAARRGKRGWAVGREIEIAPSFRRPHFAIRWMGKGRVDPRVRPIKGCLVRRKAIEEVPTDYLGSDLAAAAAQPGE